MNEREQRMRILKEGDTILAVLAVRELGAQIGMNRGAISALATAVSELTTNVVKYARTGRIMFRAVSRRKQPGLEAVVEDNGPGIADIEGAMTDRVSTGGTLGLGLPGTKRLVDEFELETSLGKGTRIRIVKWG